MPTLSCLLLLGAVAAMPAVHAATVIRWVDNNGHVHYSDSAPRDAKDSAVELEVDPNHNVYAAPPTPRFTPAPPPRKVIRLDSGPTQQETAQAANCAKAQEQFAHLRSRMRAGYRASQYNQLMERERSLQRKIEKYCH
jgi:hypothetical protein